MKPSARVSVLLTMTLAGVIPDVAAQTIYRLQQADGSTVYSDKVLPRTKVQREFTDNTSQISVIPPPASLANASPAPQASDRIGTQLARREDLWRQRNLAQAELDAARGAKARGEEPLAGERTANANGGARLNEAYWARQNALDRAIDRAQRDLERAEQQLREAGG